MGTAMQQRIGVAIEVSTFFWIVSEIEGRRQAVTTKGAKWSRPLSNNGRRIVIRGVVWSRSRGAMWFTEVLHMACLITEGWPSGENREELKVKKLKHVT